MLNISSNADRTTRQYSEQQRRSSNESPDTAFYPVIHNGSINKQFLQPRQDPNPRVNAFDEQSYSAAFITANRESHQFQATGFVPIQEEEAFTLRLRPRRFRPVNPLFKEHQQVSQQALPEQDTAFFPTETSCSPPKTPMPSVPDCLLTTPPALNQGESIDHDSMECSFLPIASKVLLPMF